MKIKVLLTALVVTLLLALGTVIPAFAVPPQPSGFYGRVTFNGGDVPNGILVRALINGVPYASNNTTTYLGHSFYFFLVPGDDPSTPAIIEGGVEGQTVHFDIGGFQADQTGVWHTGTNVNLDLTATSPTAVTLASFTGESHPGSILLELIGGISVIVVIGGGTWMLRKRRK